MFCRQTLQMLIKSVDNKCKRIEGEGGREGGDGGDTGREGTALPAADTCRRGQRVPSACQRSSHHRRGTRCPPAACVYALQHSHDRPEIQSKSPPPPPPAARRPPPAARRPPWPDGRPAQSTGEIQSREKSSSRFPTGKALIKI